MTFAVKICGLSTPETLDAALQAGADTIGFVFHPRSPRNVGLEQAASLVARTAGHARTVALIVDMPPDQARALCASVRPDLLQLHGRETPQDVAHMRAATGLKIIKAVGVAGPEDMAAIAAYRDVADHILIDAKPPKGAAYPGGHGQPFDWAILAALDPGLGFMLSGGLTPETVAGAIAQVRSLGVRLSGVDVSSGVESAPGVKDVARIRAFVAAARSAG